MKPEAISCVIPPTPAFCPVILEISPLRSETAPPRTIPPPNHHGWLGYKPFLVMGGLWLLYPHYMVHLNPLPCYDWFPTSTWSFSWVYQVYRIPMIFPTISGDFGGIPGIPHSQSQTRCGLPFFFRGMAELLLWTSRTSTCGEHLVMVVLFMGLKQPSNHH